MSRQSAPSDSVSYALSRVTPTVSRSFVNSSATPVASASMSEMTSGQVTNPKPIVSALLTTVMLRPTPSYTGPRG